MAIMSKFVQVLGFLQTQQVSQQTGDGKVQVLTKDNFDTFIKDNADGQLVEFYQPWCGHCKKLEPEYDTQQQSLFKDGVKIPLQKVDQTTQSELQSKFDVKGYPTLKYFVAGEQSEYDGPREQKGIQAWIKSMSGPQVKEQEPAGTEDCSLTLYQKTELESFSAFQKQNRKKQEFFYVKSDTEKLVIKHEGEDQIESTSVEDVKQFFSANSFPIVGKLDGDTFSKYIEKENGLIWVLMKMGQDDVKDVVSENREFMKSVQLSEPVKEKYSVTWTNTHEFGKVLESMFGITEFPRIVIQKKAGDKKNWIYDGKLDLQEFEKYITDVNSGKIEPNLKSEEPKGEQLGEPVKVITGKDMMEQVFHKEKDVMLEVYQPWCGHCKKLEPEYIKVGKKVLKEGFEDILTIQKMDGTLNDSPQDSISWSGFPTIVYTKQGSEEVIKYDGQRDQKGIWKWIKKNHSQQEKIKQQITQKKDQKKDQQPKDEQPKEEKKEEL